MAAPGPLRLVEREGGGRCLLFLSGDRDPRLHVTNAREIWSGDVTPDKLSGCRFSENGPDSSKDGISKLRPSQNGGRILHNITSCCHFEKDHRGKWREALESWAPTLTVRDIAATLRLQDGQRSLTFDLYKVPLSEAGKQLQDLMFGLVEWVHALEKRLEDVSAVPAPSPVSSPEKTTLRSQILFASDISPPKRKTGAGQASTKKRLPGESLINPGFKSKKTPTGVDFEDS